VQLDTLHSDGYSFQVEMTHRALQAGMRIVESPITFTDRQFGRSKISRAVLFESFLMPWRLRWHPWHPTEAVVQMLAAESGTGVGQK
jgi:dolichol-phosphate mannosyltransferase